MVDVLTWSYHCRALAMKGLVLVHCNKLNEISRATERLSPRRMRLNTPPKEGHAPRQHYFKQWVDGRVGKISNQHMKKRVQELQRLTTAQGKQTVIGGEFLSLQHNKLSLSHITLLV